MYILKQYDDLLHQILNDGEWEQNRTGIKTKTIIGGVSRYDIRDNYIPLLTRRRLSFKAIVAELIWYLSGDSNVYNLKKLGAGTWDSWRSEEFEQRNRYIEGSLGPLYGWNAVHWGQNYMGGNPLPKKYIGQCNQIERAIELLKENPDRRDVLILNTNPSNFYRVRLNACHFAVSFYGNSEKKTIGCALYMRSSDVPIGLPNNIVFYTLFTHLIGQQVGLTPKELVVFGGNSHIYQNQVEPVKLMLAIKDDLVPNSPQIDILKAKDISSYSVDSFRLINYNPLPKIVIPVAV